MVYQVRYGTLEVQHGVLFWDYIKASVFYDSIDVDGQCITYKLKIIDGKYVMTSTSYRKK